MFKTYNHEDIFVCGRRHRFILCQKCPLYWGIAKHHFEEAIITGVQTRSYGYYVKAPDISNVIDRFKLPAKTCRSGYWITLRQVKDSDIFVKNGERVFIDGSSFMRR